MSKIRITIDPQGKNVDFKVEGIQGEDCRAISAPYETALGDTGRAVSDTPTAEMYEKPQTAQISTEV